MQTPAITLITAAACALLQFALAVLVVQRRAAKGVLFESGGDNALLRRIRAHGNLSEYMPTALILLLTLELSRFSQTGLTVFAISFFTGRVIHAFGLLHPAWRWGRQIGMIATLFTLFSLAICAAFIGLRALR